VDRKLPQELIHQWLLPVLHIPQQVAELGLFTMVVHLIQVVLAGQAVVVQATVV
jgi:hypothetical protein